MRRLFILLLVFFSLRSFAQTDFIIRLRADTLCRSVLLSNLLPDDVGDQSPFIGMAYWKDSSKGLMECRSMLAFDHLKSISLWLEPNRIMRAYLVLKPVHPSGVLRAGYYDLKVIVRRIRDNWEDSLSTWTNQPSAYTEDQVIKRIPSEKLDQPVRINVTDMVKNMFRTGQNGFLLVFPPRENDRTISQWYASARNEDKSLRPVLELEFAASTRSNPYMSESPLYEIARRTVTTSGENTGKNEPVPVEVRNNDQKPVKE